MPQKTRQIIKHVKIAIQRIWASAIGIASIAIGILKFGSIVHIPTLDAVIHIITGGNFYWGSLDQQRPICWHNKSLAGYFLHHFRSDRYKLGSHRRWYFFHINWLINMTELCSHVLPARN